MDTNANIMGVNIVPAKVLVKTLNIERNEWLEWRRKGIGGSDAAAVVGVNPWRSSMAVYLEKIGELSEPEDNEGMYWGRILEDIIADEFSKRTGFKVRRYNAILQHKDYPFMIANIDRVYIKDGHINGILECKTTSAYNKEHWKDLKIPDAYYIQVQHYLAVTGYQNAYIACLIGGNHFVYKEIKRDDEIINYLIQIESDFWDRVEKRIPPEPDGSQDAEEILKKLYPESKEGSAITLDQHEATLMLIEELTKQKKQLEQEIEKYQQLIKADMGENEVAYIGNRKVFWKTITSTRFDSQKFKKEHPNLYVQYSKTSSYRKFEIKSGGK